MTELAPYIEDAAFEHLAIFPLPATVFFPGTELPLHVFEPRYRELVEHCLGGDRVLAVPLLKPGFEAEYDGRPPVFEVMGAGVIVDEEKLPDGRWNILLRGTDRVRLVEELPPDTSYRVIRAERLAPSGRTAEGSEPVGTLRSLALRLADAVPDVKEPLGRLLHAAFGGGDLADQLACRLVPDPLKRQRILEELDVCRRIELVVGEVAEVCLKVDPACRKNRGPAN